MTPGRLVLVVDDEADIRLLVAARLERAGFEVMTAADGDDAQALLRERRPDLVLLDVRMPRVGGLEVLEAIRADDATRDLPVILLTASVEEQSVARGLRAGATDYVAKPFSPRELVARVEAVLSAPQ